MKHEQEKQEELLISRRRFENSLIAFNEVYDQKILYMLDDEYKLSEEDIRFLSRFMLNSDSLNISLFEKIIDKNPKYTELIRAKNYDGSLNIGDDVWILTMIQRSQKIGTITDPNRLKAILKQWPRYFEKIKLILAEI